jgi:predicted phage terminase large subunit-like protein
MGVAADGTVVLSDLVHGRMEWPQALRLIADTARMDGPNVRTGVEAVGAQVGMVQSLMADPLLAGFGFAPIQVHKDKITRALPLIARAESGKFAIVRASWNKMFLDELCSFPDSSHDDMVDSATAGLTMLTSSNIPTCTLI